MSVIQGTIMESLKLGFKDARTRFVVGCCLLIISVLWIKLGQSTKEQKDQQSENNKFVINELEYYKSAYEAEKKSHDNDKFYWNAKIDTLNYKYYNLSNKFQELNK